MTTGVSGGARGVAAVTGASQGIGLAIAEALAKDGFDVAVVADTPLARQREVARALTDAYGVRASAHEVDVSSRDDTARLAREVQEGFGPVEVLVNNAGIWSVTRAGVTPLDEFDRLVDVNLRGPFYVCHHFLPAMLARGRGNLIFVGSVSGVAGDPHSAAYSATKAGIAMLARTFATTLGPKGIRVNAIAPGAVATPLTAALRTPEGSRGIQAMMKAHPSPTRRFFMEPSEIASLAAFLASDASSALHGAVLVADQGLSATMPA
jgi:NAD(P)-dependent dehydrogenase (short-subunit alcohol dehydrogenase family)